MKYVPFEFNDPADREAVLNTRVKMRGKDATDRAVRAFFMIGGFYIGVVLDGDLVVAPNVLLKEWEFVDGSPCGKEVTE